MKIQFLILAATLLITVESVALEPCKQDGSPWTDCTGTWTSENNETYVGEWNDNIPHGQGTYSWTDGRKYIGEWQGGKKSGQGTFVSADGSRFVGQWQGDTVFEGIQYDSSGLIRGTFVKAEWCEGCYPTLRQLELANDKLLLLYRDTIGNAGAVGNDQQKYHGKWCDEDSTGVVMILMDRLIWIDEEGAYSVERLLSHDEASGHVFALSESGKTFYDLFFDQPAVGTPTKGYSPLKISQCANESLTFEYVAIESSVIELDYALYQTVTECQKQGFPSCLDPLVKYLDISANGKISLPELTRFMRHLVLWLGIDNELASEALLGSAAGAQLLAPLLAKIVLLNYDYDNDQHLSVSEVLHDFAVIGGINFSREDIRRRLKAEDFRQTLETLDPERLKSLLMIFQ